MTELYIISGFLGAGKTTCIQTMVRSALKGKKIAVIENDFGESSVDAALLSECSLTVTNLSSGCICCSLTGNFRRALEQIQQDYAPDVILVEPSGVGKLSDVVKQCISLEDQGNIHLVRTITVVDVRFFEKYRKNYGEFYEDQILYADLILMSHQETCPDNLEHIAEKIREMNPEAEIQMDFWESIPGKVFRYGFRNSNILKLELEQAVSMKSVRIRRAGGAGNKQEQKAGFFQRHFARDVFSAVTVEWNAPMTREELGRRALNVLKHADGRILRGKGLVRNADAVSDEMPFLAFHFLPESISIEPTRASGHQICFIGTGLNRTQIETLFREDRTHEDTDMDHHRSA